MDTKKLLKEVREEVEKLRDLDRRRRECLSRDHSKGFCGEGCHTLYNDTKTAVLQESFGEIVQITHLPTGLQARQSIYNCSLNMARHICLDMLAKELKYRYQ